MSKKATRVDELVELLIDENVMELLVENLEMSLSPAIEELIERKLDKIIEKVLLKLNPIVVEVVSASVATRYVVLLKKMATLEEDNDKLKVGRNGGTRNEPDDSRSSES